MRHLILALLLLVQAPSGRITGKIVVLDPSGPPVAAAEVRVLYPGGEVFKELLSEEDGTFQVPDIPPGRFLVVVSTGGSTVTDACEVKAGETCSLVFEF